MCGIFGVVSLKNQQINKEKFKISLNKLSHRGPDFQSTIFLNSDTIGLGHARLSVIDLSQNANQPMFVDNRYYIVFNGEIYNYIEIKTELIEAGYVFETNSDTEVLVKAFDYWKEECVQRFNGMWAFVIYDTIKNEFFCSRDRFGVKPFNYFYDGNEFMFSSEIKAIVEYKPDLRKPNYNSIGLFCKESICGEIEETWFENILRLKPSYNLIINKEGFKTYKYYNLPQDISDISFSDAKEQFKNLFIDAVKLRMRSDVPVGTTLSGGLDSTSIMAALRTFYFDVHNTYTADFPGFENNEFPQAKRTNEFYDLKGNNILIEFNKNSIKRLQKIIYHLESGHSSPAILPLWQIYEAAKKDVTVVMEGQGADELLGGYIQHFAGDYLFEKIKKLKFKQFFREVKLLSRNYSFKTICIFFLRLSLPSYLRTFVRRHILKTDRVLIGKLKNSKIKDTYELRSKSFFIRKLQKSHQTTLVSLLHYGDAISMAFAIESRLPFMDYRLVDFAMSLPSDYLIAEGKGKFIQRESLKKILPDFINKDIKKLGFNTPIDDFFALNTIEIKKILLDNVCLNRGIFDTNKIYSLIESDFHNSLNNSYFLFRLLNVELWFRTFIDPYVNVKISEK